MGDNFSKTFKDVIKQIPDELIYVQWLV
jgi:hypothetical protein